MCLYEGITSNRYSSKFIYKKKLWLIQLIIYLSILDFQEGRTALHYCAACADSEVVWDTLIDAGCDSSVCDRRSKPAAYYLRHTSELELPDPDRAMALQASRRLRNRCDLTRLSGKFWFRVYFKTASRINTFRNVAVVNYLNKTA